MAKNDLTAQQLRDLLHYNPETGAFTWKARSAAYGTWNARAKWNERSVGKVVGLLSPAGYVRIPLFCNDYRAHRLAWLYTHGVWPAKEIDHINGNRADNRIINLREATSAGNKQNAHKPRGSTGLLGVSKRKNGTFEAKIGIGGRVLHIGTFSTADEAHSAYVERKRQIHPFGML